jgi:transcription initiation factor IIF auxiliary subunit
LSYLRSSSSHLKTNTILHNLFREQYEKEYELRRIETENERKQIIKKRFIIGNIHQLLPCDYDYTRHEWTLFVKFDNDDQDDINQYIQQITINLHPTFTPSQIILDKSPFCLTRIGW